MGTRNITSVILGGKQVVCQYGQWDGYPSYTGLKILEFLRDSDLEQFRKALENTEITVTNIDDALTYTGSTKQLSEISNAVFKVQTELNRDNKGYVNGFEAVHRMVKDGTITEQQAEDYLVGTRDTGCDILKLIYSHSPEKPPLELFALTDEYNGQYGWDIQGVYVIDLDSNTVRMKYDGYSQTYDIAHLPPDIEKEMLIFEKATQKMYELGYRDKAFLDNPAAASSEKDPVVLYRQATECAAAICEEIKAEAPLLLSVSDEAISAEHFGQALIYRFLCEKNGVQPQTFQSFEALVASAQEKRLEPSSRGKHAPEAVQDHTK